MIFKILKYISASLTLAAGIIFCCLVGETGTHQVMFDQATKKYDLTMLTHTINYDTLFSQQLLTGQSWQTKSNVLQVTAQHDANYTANQLLKIMLTYDDSSSYNAREGKAKQFAESPVLSNPDFFGNDKQKDGSHLINAKRLHSKFLYARTSIDFVSNDLANVMIKSVSKHWTGTLPASQLTVLYVGTYNLATQKYQKLTYVGTIDDNSLFKKAV